MRLFILGLSLAFVAGLSAAQESETQDNVEAEESVEQRVVITGSRLSRDGFKARGGTAPVPLIDSDPLPPRSPQEALEDPDTRIYALRPESFAYREVPDNNAFDKLSQAQKDNLRFFTNPVVRNNRTLGVINVDDFLKHQGLLGQTPGKD